METLTLPETRALGVLIEKKIITPDQYPLTLNSVRVACNQKTSRHPVVDYSELTVNRALQTLEKKGYVKQSIFSTARATKYEHTTESKLLIDKKEVILLGLLMLRGAQTPGELRMRSQRMWDFPSVEAVEDTLLRLINHKTPLVQVLDRQPGQKECRYIQLLSEIDEEALRAHTTTYAEDSASVAADDDAKTSANSRIDELEDKLNALTKRVELLEQSLLPSADGDLQENRDLRNEQ
ncbi:MAG: YceH family protein [Deltaproteobacteria bacterium]|nr:YceH family protein [Deltaproteobacteria bacterium]